MGVHTQIRTAWQRSAVATLGAALLALGACTTEPETVEDPKPSKEITCGRLMVPDASGQKCVSVNASGVNSKPVTFPSKKTPGGLVSLNGVLTTPKWATGAEAPRKSPGVILIHGSGPLGRDSLLTGDLTGPFAQPVPLFKDLAESLSARGYTVLRYDKRTCTAQSDPACSYPAEVAKQAGWEDLRGDVEAAAAFLGSQPGVDPQDIILVGHSQGSTLALEAGKTVKPRALVLLAGTFEPIDQVLARQARWQLDHQQPKPSPKELEKAKGKISELESTFLAIREGQIPDEELFMGSTVGFWKAWINASNATPDLLRTFNRPVLYVRGTADQNAAEQDQQGFEAALKGKAGAQVVSLPDHTHALSLKGEAKAGDKLTKALLDWLAAP